MYIYISAKMYIDRYECMISLVDFVLTSVNARFTGVSMEITTRDLAV